MASARGEGREAFFSRGHLRRNSVYDQHRSALTFTFGIYALERVLSWLEDNGGIDGIDAANQAKSDALYAQIDKTGFWSGHAESANRSRMNVAFRSPNEELDAAFLKASNAAGLMGLKGHRSVGGLRASIYNACPIESVQALVSFMGEFERTHG